MESSVGLSPSRSRLSLALLLRVLQVSQSEFLRCVCAATISRSSRSGFGQIIVVFLNNIEAVGGARGYSGIPIVKSFFWIFLIAVLTIVIVYNIVNSAFGRALISIREDELAAEAMGVNTTRYKVMAFVISSAMAGAGGVLLAHFDGYLNPKSFEFIKSFEILIMIILGGLGSIVGSVIGAIVLTILPESLRGFAEYRMVIYSLLPDHPDDHATAGIAGLLRCIQRIPQTRATTY